jgi:hypothetical protein
VRDGRVDDRARKLGVRVETGADCAKGFFNVAEDGVVAACGGVESRSVGSLEGVECDGWFCALGREAGVVASLDGEGECLPVSSIVWRGLGGDRGLYGSEGGGEGATGCGQTD